MTFLLILYISSSVLTVAISVGSRIVVLDKKWKVTLVCAGALLLVVNILTGTETYRETWKARTSAKQQEQLLTTELTSLKDQNRIFHDEIGDCNARAEALTKKFHAPVQFTRGVFESSKTHDSVAVK